MIAALGNCRAALAALFVLAILLAGPLAAGASADANLSADPTGLTFEDQVVSEGPSTAQAVEFTSDGDLPIEEFGTFVLTGATPDAFTFTTTCPSPGHSLGIGGTCKVFAKFDPSAAGPHSANLEMDLPGTIPDIQVPLEGMAVEPEINTDPGDFSFLPWATNAGPSAPDFVRIHNTGSSPLQLGAAVFTGADASSFATASDNCSGRSLLPSVFCDVAVSFDPSSPGAKTAALRFTHNAATGVTELPIAATAFEAPTLPLFAGRAKMPKLRRIKHLVVTVKCPVSTCNITATANLYLPVAGKRKKTRRSTLGWKQAVITGGGAGKIVFRLSGGQRYALAEAARRGKAIRADASLTAWSEGYSDAASEFSFKLR